MILLEGSITNKVINGAKGDFSVGNLVTDIGNFKIRSQLLDPYEEGEYRVRVAINRLDLNSYPSKRNGITITEIQAEISHLEMLDEDIKTIEETSIEPDVTVEEDAPAVTSTAEKPAADETKAKSTAKAEAKASKPEQQKPSKAKASAAEKPAADISELEQLFGALWPLGDSVKLDSTTPRGQFIKQKDYLKKQGYRFNGADQTFFKASS